MLAVVSIQENPCHFARGMLCRLTDQLSRIVSASIVDQDKLKRKVHALAGPKAALDEVRQVFFFVEYRNDD
jgi:hypothetical protein